MAQAREARSIEEQAAEAIRRALPAEFVAELEGRDPEARKRKKIEGAFGLDGYEAPDDVYYARGANAVNPIGRQGLELEDEQRLMIEAGTVGQESFEQEPSAPQYEESTAGGIFSSSTLAAIKSSQGSFASKPARPAASGPLVAYGSDSDSE